MKHIKLIGGLPLYTEGESQGYINLWDFSLANSNNEARVEAVTKVVEVCRGKVAQYPEKLYKQLLTEHNGKAGAAFEFVPLTYTKAEWDALDYGDIVEFTDLNNLTTKRTNLRAALNCQDDDMANLYSKEPAKDFVVVEVKFPYTVGPHILHHKKLSFMCASERHQQLREYYYCEELKDIKEEELQPRWETWNYICNTSSQANWDYWQQKYNIRKELTNKGSHGLMFVKYFLAGWISDPKRWGNFIKVRYSNPAMKELQVIARALLHLLVKHNIATIETLVSWDNAYPDTPRLAERYEAIKDGKELI